ncbi:MAG: cation transporter [Planctomycetes bacterium]|nr:cation transporter [Planctomycetota bacterium]
MSQPSPVAIEQRVVRVHRLNLVVNLGLAGMKLSLGFASGSGALVADGLNSTSDLVSNAVAWLGYRWSQAPPDEDHHYGHGNFEAVASMVIGFVILGAGLGVVWRAFTSHDVTHGGALGWAALAAAAVSMLTCFWLARRTLAVGLATHSSTLIALGRDKYSDALSGSLVFVAIGGSLADLSWVEPPITVLVGAWISVLGFRSVSEGLDVLVDRVRDPALREELELAAAAVPGVASVRDVRLHPLGATYGADLTVCVDGALTVRDGHAIAVAVEDAISQAQSRVVSVVVHVEPA